MRQKLHKSTGAEERSESGVPEEGVSSATGSVTGRNRPGRGAGRWSALLLPAATVAGLLVVAEIVTRAEVLGPYFPPVTEVARELNDRAGSRSLWMRVGETLTAAMGGFLLATVIAIPLGLLVAANQYLFRSTRLIIEFLRPIPPVAVLPLAVLLLGTGTEMKVYLVAFAAVWPILFQTLYGAQDVDPVTRDSTRVYGLNAWQQYRYVVIPSGAPYIATGLRLAATIALVVAIATELIVGSTGLGYEINQVRYAGNIPAMYALISVTGLLGWLLAAGLSAMERRVLRWHHSHRESS